jgi:hypothetical protein
LPLLFIIILVRIVIMICHVDGCPSDNKERKEKKKGVDVISPTVIGKTPKMRQEPLIFGIS